MGAVDLHHEVGGHHAQLLGDLHAELAHLGAAPRAGPVPLGQVVLDDDGLQPGQVDPARAAAPPLPLGGLRRIRHGLGRAVGRRLGVVEERELVGVDALGPGPEERLLQQLELLDEPGVLGPLRVDHGLELRPHGGHGLLHGGAHRLVARGPLALQLDGQLRVVSGERPVVGGERREGQLQAGDPLQQGRVVVGGYVGKLLLHDHIIPHIRR